MAKKSRNRVVEEPLPLYDGQVVGAKQPCPCGSGRRYKVCHGDASATTFVKRPFEGLPGECDIVAMRELVPAATAPLTIKGHEDRTVLLASLLPVAAPAMHRDSGQVWVGLQVRHSFGDPSREVAAALLDALAATEPGIIGVLANPGPGSRLQDIVVGGTLDVTVHEGFDFWLADLADTEGLEEALQEANQAADPTVRLGGVEAAYWTNVGSKELLRWVMPEPEEDLLSAFARLHISGDDVIVPGARLIGMFRAYGLLAPVWDLPLGTGAEVLEEPAAELRRKLDALLAAGGELTAEERSARAGLANRQVTIR
ncbi:DUF5926 family protein [Nocardioides sp.]|uniref:DUF5926 family protein n=1 Tax=Nocardioides sp. TaxID=35761 RepID=UPI0039E3557D